MSVKNPKEFFVALLSELSKAPSDDKDLSGDQPCPQNPDIKKLSRRAPLYPTRSLPHSISASNSSGSSP